MNAHPALMSASTFVVVEMSVTSNNADRLSAADVWKRYEGFCIHAGLPTGSRTDLSQALTALGARRIKSNGRIFYACVRWKRDGVMGTASASLTAKLLRVTENLFERRTLSVTEFCRAYGLGRNTYYRMEQAGRGPRTMRIGAAKRIHVDAAEEWARRVEREPISFH